MLSLTCIKFARGPAATMSIDILKRLFEQHFHAPPERVQPLQGQLGGSGRIIVRLAGEMDNAPSTLDSASNSQASLEPDTGPDI
jgi:hypothetical protein